MENNSEREIGPKTKANDIMRLYPETTDYFVGLGVCDCGFGGPFARSSMTKTLEEIAREKDVPVEEMAGKIKSLIEA